MAVTEAAPPRPVLSPANAAHAGVLAVVVTHRGRPWLKDCLVALSAQTHGPLDVLVVDDASPDHRSPPHLKRLAKRHLRRRRWAYLRTPRPLGFGGAVNWALSRVRSRAQLLLFIHDDAALDPQAVERMVARVAADDTTAIVGPKIVSWDDPTRLEEVGMAADRFGYPYKGLEEGEIDLGQHDVSTEVFFISSTCMLVRHEVFRELRGFDARMRAYAKDLDLCWRAHIKGYGVRVEPEAKARHAIALARGERESPFTPARYYIRRNRLRAVTKNASSLRLLGLIPQFILLALAEMLAFVVLRQPREIVNLARALGWNLVSIPQTLTERTRVQRARRVADRGLRRLTVRQSTRLRSYLAGKADRLEEVWGRRTELVSRSTRSARSIRGKALGLPGVVALVALVGLLLGFRDLLWAGPVAVGELLPYPHDVTSLWRALASPWNPVGLGQPGPAPPAYALLGLVPLIALGTGAAQKLLVLGLLGVAFVGAYRLVADLVDRPARYVAGIVYAAGPVGYVAVRGGALGALVFGAIAPFVLLILARQTGWVRPPAWDRARGVARLALAGAISGAFVPGSLVLYGVVAVLLAASRSILDRGSFPARSLVGPGIGLVGAWALLLPWSAGWFGAGGPLDRLTDPSSAPAFAASFRGHGVASVVLGQTPDGPALFGLSLALLGVIAVAIGDGQRRRLALALWGVLIVVGWLVTAISSGWLDPVVASPAEAGVLAAACFAGLAGLAVGAFRLDLPRRGLGIHQGLALVGMGVAAVLLAAGLLPALWHGDWAPGRGSQRAAPPVVEQVRSLLAAEGDEVGRFRALWVGESWGPPDLSAARPVGSHIVTGPRGQVLSNLFEHGSGPAYGQLASVIASIENGGTDRGGSLLGAFNIRFLVVERSPEAEPWLDQGDLAVVRTEPAYLLLENEAALARVGVYPELPGAARAIQTGDPARAVGPAEPATAVAEPRAPHRYEGGEVGGPGVVFAAEAYDPAWRAALNADQLEAVDGGWANAFAIPSGARGDLSVAVPRSVGQVLWLVVMALAWIVVLGASFSRRPISPAGRGRR
ncbi:MAG: glycosyltransferase [Actinomycetota bacterium]